MNPREEGTLRGNERRNLIVLVKNDVNGIEKVERFYEERKEKGILEEYFATGIYSCGI